MKIERPINSKRKKATAAVLEPLYFIERGAPGVNLASRRRMITINVNTKFNTPLKKFNSGVDTPTTDEPLTSVAKTYCCQ
jgi:hypothetical protein